jgi:hypothetical protein
MLDPSYLRSIRDGILSGNIEANNNEALPDGLVGSSLELLQLYCLNHLIFDNLNYDQIKRFNSSLNIKWAIDIKNRLSN